MKFYTKILFVSLFSLSILAQVPGLKLDFNNGDISGWTSEFSTYQLSANDSALKIIYQRDSSSGTQDNFIYTPPIKVIPSDKQSVSIKVKSDFAATISLKAVYYKNVEGAINTQTVTGDNQWQILDFQLTNFNGNFIEKIYLYVDRGTAVSQTGTVYFDEIIIGNENYTLNISSLTATILDTTTVKLNWVANYPSAALYYNLYKGNTYDFVCDSSSFIDSLDITSFTDSEIVPYESYYYRVTAVGAGNVETEPSDYVKVRTLGANPPLLVDVEKVSSPSVGKYDMIEIYADFFGAEYENPYDPDEIDLRAEFISPTDSVWSIFGYYDNYNNLNEWKIRFSPNEIGQWKYKLTLKNSTGNSTLSKEYTFETVESENHGWIKVSKESNYYFQYDDGNSFYGIGVYYPWSVDNSSTGLGLLESKGVNLWGYWNSTYDKGSHLIESMSSGLGRYDQDKCNRLDNYLTWSEERNMNMQLALWPHDLLADNISWSTDWDSNPYNTIMGASAFFDNEEGWKYQEKQYRYLIARFSAFRSLGIWEIVNEITGTDAWFAGKSSEGLEWVRKVNQYFKENDPYQHPTTANKHGGLFWTDGYNAVDVGNVHLYETSWSRPYSDYYRASLTVYKNVSRQFRSNISKPGMMGEAGDVSTFGNFATPSSQYTELYHNALWTTWSNGNASTPLWWDFANRNVISDDVLDQLKAFSTAIKYVDYAHKKFISKTAEAENCDVFVLGEDTTFFGWIRDYTKASLSNREIKINGVADTFYTLKLINAWTGAEHYTMHVSSSEGVFTVNLPELPENMIDLAFIAIPDPEDLTGVIVQNGNLPEKFVLSQNYPNPFNPSTTIEYSIPKEGNVTMKVFNILGQEVSTLVNELKSPGQYKVRFDAASLASGVYIYTVKSAAGIQSKKMMFLK